RCTPPPPPPRPPRPASAPRRAPPPPPPTPTAPRRQPHRTSGPKPARPTKGPTGVGPFVVLLVREGGVESPRPCGHWNLNPARLPIPPPAHRVCRPVWVASAAPSDRRNNSTWRRCPLTTSGGRTIPLREEEEAERVNSG